MLASSIEWLLVVSGIPTAAAGLAALFFPKRVLGWCSDQPIPALSRCSLRAIGSLAVRCVLSNGLRGVFSRHPRPNPDSSYRELAIFILTFFGKLPRTPAMVAIAVTDGLLAVLFTFYLVEQ
jgi:hypothetical protein